MAYAQDFLDSELGSLDVGGGGGYMNGVAKKKQAFFVPNAKYTSAPLTVSQVQAVAPGSDPHYSEVQQTQADAKDNGKMMPEAASRYLAYQQDPDWQKLDTEQSSALGGVGGGFAPILDRLTHGYYSRAKLGAFEMASQKKREIERRYYDSAAINEANREHFNYGQQRPEYNQEKGIWERVVYGDKGGRSALGETAGPVKEYTDQFGEKGSYTERPGTKPMIVDKDAVKRGWSTKSESDPAFGGQAEGLPPMTPLGQTPEELAKVAREKALADEAAAATGAHNAQAGLYGAQTKKAGFMEVSPGASVLNTDTSRNVFTAPQTGQQARGDGAGKGMTQAEAARQATDYARGVVSANKLNEYSEKGSALFADEFAKKYAEFTGQAPPSTPAPPVGKTPEAAVEWEKDEKGQPRPKKR